MGMFDTWEFDASYDSTFVCEECGGKLSGMQTKDFDCFLDRIRVDANGQLEVKSPMCGDDGEEHQRWRVIKDTCYARAYSSCPVDRTWNEWRLHVREGVVKEIIRMPGRD